MSKLRVSGGAEPEETAPAQPASAQAADLQPLQDGTVDTRIDDLITAISEQRGSSDLQGLRREVLDLRTALNQLWVRMSAEARDDVVRAYATVRMLRNALEVPQTTPIEQSTPAFPPPAEQPEPTIPSKLFVIDMRQNDGKIVRVAVRSHSHDGARTRMYGTEWFRDWSSKHSNHIDVRTFETEDTLDWLTQSCGVLPIAVDEPLLKVHKVPTDKHVWYMRFGIMTPDIGDVDLVSASCRSTSRKDAEAYLLRSLEDAALASGAKLQVMSRTLVSDSEVTWLDAGALGPTLRALPATGSEQPGPGGSS